MHELLCIRPSDTEDARPAERGAGVPRLVHARALPRFSRALPHLCRALPRFLRALPRFSRALPRFLRATGRKHRGLGGVLRSHGVLRFHFQRSDIDSPRFPGVYVPRCLGVSHARLRPPSACASPYSGLTLPRIAQRAGGRVCPRPPGADTAPRPGPLWPDRAGRGAAASATSVEACVADGDRWGRAPQPVCLSFARVCGYAHLGAGAHSVDSRRSSR